VHDRVAPEVRPNAVLRVADSLFDDPVRASFEGDAEAFANVSTETLLSDRIFKSRVNDRATVSIYETADRENIQATAELPNGRLGDFLDRLRTTTTDDLSAAGIEPIGVPEETQERRTRRELRETARDALPSVVDDPDAYGVDARADGSLILQDRDTGRTETVDVSGGNVGGALEDAAGGLGPEANGPGRTLGSSTGGFGGAALAAVLGLVALVLAWLGGNA